MIRLRTGIAGATIATLLLGGCAVERLHQQGLDAIQQGRYEAGVDDLAQAAQRDPSNLTYRLDLQTQRDASVQKLIALADAARGAGRLEEAAATYRRVLAIDSANDRAA